MAILPGTRIRDNGIFGTTTDNPLTAGAATYNSAALALLSTVAGNHALVTLDPLRQFGEPEIVMITAHTAAATVATITRGMFGTIARSHPVSTLWVHAAADNDFIEVLTSATRPADQYEGQFIYETDTNKLVGFGGVDWAPRDAGGQIGYAQVVASQTLVAAADLTGLSVGVTVGTGRRIKITGQVLFDNDAAANTVFLNTMEGGTRLTQAIAGAAANGSPGELQTIVSSVIISPSAGAHTYHLRGDATLFNIVAAANATLVNFILVEDIGAA